jgi:hypothetical protein
MCPDSASGPLVSAGTVSYGGADSGTLAVIGDVPWAFRPEHSVVRPAGLSGGYYPDLSRLQVLPTCPASAAEISRRR